MSMFQINSPDLQHLVSYLENVKKNADEGPGLDTMKLIGEEGMKDVEERFDTKGFGTWVPLSPLTIAKKGHNQILFDTGNMKKSIGIGEIKINYVSVVVPHAGKDFREDIPGIHQLGTDKIPQRKIVEITDQLIERLDPIVEEWYQNW